MHDYCGKRRAYAGPCSITNSLLRAPKLSSRRTFASHLEMPRGSTMGLGTKQHMWCFYVRSAVLICGGRPSLAC